MPSTARSRSFMGSATASEASSPAQGVSGVWYRFRTRAPTRSLSASLNEGWKKFTNKREEEYRRASASPAARPSSLPIADEATNHRPVLLFDPGLIVLSIGTGSGELDAVV